MWGVLAGLVALGLLAVGIIATTTPLIRERRARLEARQTVDRRRDQFSAIYDREIDVTPEGRSLWTRLALRGLYSELQPRAPRRRRNLIASELDRRAHFVVSIAPATYALGGAIAVPTLAWFMRSVRDYEPSGFFSQFADWNSWSLFLSLGTLLLLGATLLNVQGITSGVHQDIQNVSKHAAAGGARVARRTASRTTPLRRTRAASVRKTSTPVQRARHNAL